MLMAVVLFFSACNLRAEQISVSWDGGGDTRSWEDPYNWDPNTVPENNASDTFAVTIDSGSGEIEVTWEYEHTIDRLDCYGDVSLEGPPWEWTWLTLVDASGLTNHGVLGINSQGLELCEIHGNVTNTSGALLDLHGAKIEGNITNQMDATIEANGEVDVRDGSLVNAGLVVIGDHELNIKQNMYNTGQVKIYTGGLCVGDILDNDANAVITGLGVIFAGEDLVNNGRIFATGGDLVLATGQGTFLNSGIIGNAALTALNLVGFSAPTGDANNQGTIEANAGGGVAFDSNLVNEPNATITLLGGTLSAPNITQSADATFEGQGNITTDNLLIETDGFIRLNGPTNIFGDVQIEPNGTLEISDGLTLVKGETTCNGTIHMKGGWLIPQGGITGTCNVIWEPGLYTNVADFNLDGKVDFKDFSYFANTWLWKTSWF